MSQSVYQQIIDSLKDYALFMIDTNGTIKTWSNCAESIKMYKKEEIIGKNFKIFYTDEDLKAGKPQKELEKAAKTGISEDEYWRVRKDGSKFWCSVRISPIYDENTKLVGFSKLTRDLTDKRSKYIIREASKTKNAFIAQMSHEIRTPMNGVISAASLLYETDLNKEQKELVTIAVESGKILLKVVNDILDFTKMESNEVKLFEECFDFYAEINKITHNFEINNANRSMKFTKTVAKNVPQYVQGDPFRFRQVLTNLIDNAMKFTAKGMVTVRITSILAEKDIVIIKVQILDTGIGVSEEDRTKLFKPYQQLDATCKRRFKGTGLGLSICKYLTSLMKGSIGVEGNEGGGSIFWFTVSFLVSDYDHVKNYPRKEIFNIPPKFPNAQILLVDDNAINLNVALRILSKLGYTHIDTAYDGAEAVKSVREKKYDLVIMDIQMPVMNGYEASQEIRKFNETIPIIAMTANALEGDADLCLQAGANDYLGKPLDFSLLSIALNRWVYGSF